MVNATKITALFGKRPSNFLKYRPDIREVAVVQKRYTLVPVEFLTELLEYCIRH
jgi:hypothetical protein